MAFWASSFLPGAALHDPRAGSGVRFDVLHRGCPRYVVLLFSFEVLNYVVGFFQNSVAKPVVESSQQAESMLFCMRI